MGNWPQKSYFLQAGRRGDAGRSGLTNLAICGIDSHSFMTPNPKVVYLVVGTLAFVLVAYAATLSICALIGIAPNEKVLDYLKDLGIFASGALASLLARTGSAPEQPTEVVAPRGEPLKVQEEPPTYTEPPAEYEPQQQPP